MRTAIFMGLGLVCSTIVTGKFCETDEQKVIFLFFIFMFLVWDLLVDMFK